jgi:hypothetical protein
MPLLFLRPRASVSHTASPLRHHIAPRHHTTTHQGYLWTLKCCHSGANMDTAAEMAKGAMDDETRAMVFDVLGNRCARRSRT